MVKRTSVLAPEAEKMAKTKWAQCHGTPCIISMDCKVEFPKFFFFMTNKKPTPMYVLAKELDPTACCIPKVGIAMKASILEVSALRAPAGVVAYGVGEAGVALFYHLSSALSL